MIIRTNYTNELKKLFFVIPALLALLAIPLIDESSSQESVLLLQTGMISTSSADYEISSDFDIRIIGDGDYIRIKGMTVSGYPYYVYEKTINGESMLYGKIFVGGTAVPVVHKEIQEVVEEPVQQSIQPKNDLIIAIQHPTYGYYTQTYSFVTKVFDLNQNPKGVFDWNLGKRTNVDVTLSLIDPNGKVLATETGKTNTQGIFSGSYFWQYSDAIGTYTVKVTADDGTNKVTKEFTTSYNGYHPFYSGSQNP